MLQPLVEDTLILEANLRFFQDQDPALIHEIEGARPYPLVQASLAPELPALVLRDVPLHCLEDPKAEAVRLIGPHKSGLHLHFGLGLGYLLQADQTKAGGCILVYEPDPNLVRTVLGVLALEASVLCKNIHITCNFNRFQYLAIKNMVHRKSSRFVMNPAHTQLFPEAFGHFHRFLNQINRETRMTPVSSLFPTILSSTWRSARLHYQHPGVEYWQGHLNGKPAVLIAAGPSLEKNLHQLIPFRDKVVIYAVARVAALLEEHGIEPDFLVHVESQDFAKFIEGRTNLSRTRFLLADQTERQYYQYPCRQIYGFHSKFNPLSRCLEEPFPETRRMDAKTGGSVATAAFYLAYMAGCNPIVLIGQDLAKGQAWYAGKSEPQHIGEATRWVPGYFGGKVETLPNYANNIAWYEEAIPAFQQRDPKRIMINATEGGAMIKGFIQRKLHDTAVEYFQEPLSIEEPDLSHFTPLSAETWETIEQTITQVGLNLHEAATRFHAAENQVALQLSTDSFDIDVRALLSAWMACFASAPWLTNLQKMEWVTANILLKRLDTLPPKEHWRIMAPLVYIYRNFGIKDLIPLPILTEETFS